jgi:hypothetical protein
MRPVLSARRGYEDGETAELRRESRLRPMHPAATNRLSSDNTAPKRRPPDSKPPPHLVQQAQQRRAQMVQHPVQQGKAIRNTEEGGGQEAREPPPPPQFVQATPTTIALRWSALSRRHELQWKRGAEYLPVPPHILITQRGSCSGLITQLKPCCPPIKFRIRFQFQATGARSLSNYAALEWGEFSQASEPMQTPSSCPPPPPPKPDAIGVNVADAIEINSCAVRVSWMRPAHEAFEVSWPPSSYAVQVLICSIILLSSYASTGFARY